MEKKKNKGGRPRKFFLDKALDEIFDLIKKDKRNVALFKTIVHCCAYFKISNDTWYNNIKEAKEQGNERILDTIKRLKTIQEAWWIDAGLSGKVNPTAWVFCQKNIAGWTDKKQIDANVNVGHEDIVKYMQSVQEDET